MGLFDAKPSQASNVLPEVADCDRQLTALNQRREELIRQIGELYLENNDSTAGGGNFDCGEEKAGGAGASQM